MKGNYPPFSEIMADHAIDETLQVIAEANVAIEINTSGKTKLSGGWYPSDAILERARHYGVKSPSVRMHISLEGLRMSLSRCGHV